MQVKKKKQPSIDVAKLLQKHIRLEDWLLKFFSTLAWIS